MGFKVFADANLLLDFSLKRENYSSAREIIRNAIEGKIQLFITPSVLHITAYWVTKGYGNKRAKELLLSLLADIEVVDCDHSTCVMAIHSGINDIEDALQYYTALKHGIEYFISADKMLKKTAIPQLPVYTAEEFLEKHTLQ
jgi:predicted nucleic acid-binding protein